MSKPDNTQELDEILTSILENYEVVLLDETGNEQIATLVDIAEPADDLLPPIKQAILDWHNKQVEELLDRLTVADNISDRACSEAIQAERNKLKERDDE